MVHVNIYILIYIYIYICGRQTDQLHEPLKNEGTGYIYLGM